MFVIKFGKLFRQNTSIIIEELTLLSTSILFYANFGREVLGFLTSCHPLWSANLSCQFYLSFPNLRDRALREMKLVALEQELFQHNVPKIHLFLHPPKMPINSIFKVSHGKARQTRKEDFQTFHNHVCGPSSRKAFLKGICFITAVSNHRDFTFVKFYEEMIHNTNHIKAQRKKQEDV